MGAHLEKWCFIEHNLPLKNLCFQMCLVSYIQIKFYVSKALENMDAWNKHTDKITHTYTNTHTNILNEMLGGGLYKEDKQSHIPSHTQTHKHKQTYTNIILSIVVRVRFQIQVANLAHYWTYSTFGHTFQFPQHSVLKLSDKCTLNIDYSELSFFGWNQNLILN